MILVGTEPSLDLGEAMLGPVESDPGRLQGLAYELWVGHSFRFVKVGGNNNVVFIGESHWKKKTIHDISSE